jgi:hypothetical protein
MSYSGSTASSSLANPPRLISAGALYGGVGGSSSLTTVGSTAAFAQDSPNIQGGQLWYYCSTNLTTDLTEAGFFSDGADLGMRVGDLVICTQFSSFGSSVMMSMHPVTVVDTTAGDVDLSAGTAGYLSTTRGTSI